MSIEGISSVGLRSFYDSDAVENSEEIKSLTNQKARLQQELSDIRNDKNLDEDAKKIKMQHLASQIDTLQNKIETLSNTEGKNNNKRSDPVIDIGALKKQREKLHNEMADIRHSSVYSNEEKRMKIHELLMEINSVKTQISTLRKEQIRDEQMRTGRINIEEIKQEMPFFKNQKADNKQEEKTGFINKVDILI